MPTEKLPIGDLLAALGVGGTLLFVILVTLVAIVAFLGKWTFGELSSSMKIRREFADATGKQIAALANQHYWAIANAAGTLSVGLRSYLEDVEVRLYLRWPSPDRLNQAIGEAAQRVSGDTFPSLAQFIWSLHNFQFVGSNDYLLPHRSASTHLRRLYNGFRHSLTSSAFDGDDLATGILQNGRDKNGANVGDKDAGEFNLEATLRAASRRMDHWTSTPGPAAGPDADAGPADRSRLALADAEMERLRLAWAGWLAGNLPSVLSAKNALEAFSRLLQYELAELYEDWFRDQKIVGDLATVESAVAQKKWFGMITRAELSTLLIAREQHDFMTPLRKTAGGFAKRRTLPPGPGGPGDGTPPDLPPDAMHEGGQHGVSIPETVRAGAQASVDPARRMVGGEVLR